MVNFEQITTNFGQIMNAIESTLPIVEDMDEVEFGTFIAMLSEEKCYQIGASMVTFISHLYDVTMQIHEEFGNYDKFAEVDVEID